MQLNLDFNPALFDLDPRDEIGQPSLSPQQITRLLEINLALNAVQDPQSLLNLIITSTIELLDCEAASIWLNTEGPEMLVCATSTNMNRRPMLKEQITLAESLAGEIFRRSQPLSVDEIPQDLLYDRKDLERAGSPQKTLLGVPLFSQDRVIGVLVVANKCSGEYERADMSLLSFIASQAALAIKNNLVTYSLQQAFAELDQMEAFKRNFISIASHELRTPLSVIFVYADLLAESGQGRTSEHAARVLDAARRLQSLVDKLTDLDLLKLGSLELHPLPSEIVHILQRAYLQASPAAEAKGQRFVFTTPDEPLLVNADADQLCRAFACLFDNAVRFSPNQAHIQVRVSASDDEIKVALTDPGVGIPEKELESIFKEFYQVEHHLSRRVGGMGLGLAIARGLFALHGGRIWAESKGLDKGATFTTCLPRLKGELQAAGLPVLQAAHSPG